VLVKRLPNFQHQSHHIASKQTSVQGLEVILTRTQLFFIHRAVRTPFRLTVQRIPFSARTNGHGYVIVNTLCCHFPSHFCHYFHSSLSTLSHLLPLPIPYHTSHLIMASSGSPQEHQYPLRYQYPSALSAPRSPSSPSDPPSTFAHSPSDPAERFGLAGLTVRHIPNIDDIALIHTRTPKNSAPSWPKARPKTRLFTTTPPPRTSTPLTNTPAASPFFGDDIGLLFFRVERNTGTALWRVWVFGGRGLADHCTRRTEP